MVSKHLLRGALAAPILQTSNQGFLQRTCLGWEAVELDTFSPTRAAPTTPRPETYSISGLPKNGRGQLALTDLLQVVPQVQVNSVFVGKGVEVGLRKERPR